MSLNDCSPLPYKWKPLNSKADPVTVRVSVRGASKSSEPFGLVAGKVQDATVQLEVPDAPLWSPEHPNLITATIEILRDGKQIDRKEERFGFRTIETRGNRLLLNGHPIYLRGYGDDNVEVLTGFPPASRAVYLQRLSLAKSFGFNAVRYHSMVPPKEFFDAADEVGMLIMAELPAVYTQYFFAHQDYLRNELQSVLLAYRNHPSLLSLAFGNEFNLHWLKSDEDRRTFVDAIGQFYAFAKQLAPATLILSNDGFDLRPTDMVSLPEGAAPDRPTIRHEFGDYYCSLPDIGLIDQFTGVLVPDWLKAKQSWVMKNSLQDVYSEYLRNSKRLQQLGRKYQIERVRENKAVTGYDYWLIVDYPGGTGEGDSWEEGWFDYFWKPKAITPEQGRELNAPVLLMIGNGVNDRTMWTDEQKHVPVKVSNFGPGPIEGATLSWSLQDGSKQIGGGDLRDVSIAECRCGGGWGNRSGCFKPAGRYQTGTRVDAPVGPGNLSKPLEFLGVSTRAQHPRDNRRHLGYQVGGFAARVSVDRNEYQRHEAELIYSLRTVSMQPRWNTCIVAGKSGCCFAKA